MSAKACKRFESAGVFAVEALSSKDAAIPSSFATLLLLMCELSAPRMAFSRAAIRSAGKAWERFN